MHLIVEYIVLFASIFSQLFQSFLYSYLLHSVIIKTIKKSLFELHHEAMRSNQELHTRMHPWLAGAQYRTTAVVLVYRLISLIGPHCPASTYSSTCPSLSMHFVVHGREKERGNVGGVSRREKERRRISYVHACVLTVVGARQSGHYLRNIYLVITSTMPYHRNLYID